MVGIMEAGSPHEMHRSYKLRYPVESAGPRTRLTAAAAAAREAARCCPSGVIGGIFPSGGSTTSHGRLPLVISNRSDQ
jgi:hypothetical protein